MSVRRHGTTSSVATTNEITLPDAKPPFAADQAGDCLVILYSGERSDLAKRFVLDSSQGALVVGRGSRCDVVLESDAVSRRHARFEPRSDGWWVHDLDSTNGTYVNFERVVEQRLQCDDLVQ